MATVLVRPHVSARAGTLRLQPAGSSSSSSPLSAGQEAACASVSPLERGEVPESSQGAGEPQREDGLPPQLHPADAMAAPAGPWCLPLILLLPLATPLASAAVNGAGCWEQGGGPAWVPLQPAAHYGLSPDASELSCFYNSKANISCVWSGVGRPPGTSCHLRAKSNVRDWNKTCELFPGRQASWACNLVLGRPESQPLNSVDIVNVSVMCWQDGQWHLAKTQAFKPFESLRLLAPHSLRVLSVGTHRCNVTWRTSLVSHYVESYLEFEVRTRSPGHRWEEAPLLSLKQPQQWICLETLAPDTQYELQVRVRPQRGDHTVWSPWSQPLAFRTRPAAPGKDTLPLPWLSHAVLGLGAVAGFVASVYFLAHCRYLGPWLKKVLKCRIPDPSEFFSQLSSQHGGDLQKWLSSPLPSSSFNTGGPAPEISPLEVLDRDAKAAQLLLLQQDKATSPSPSGRSQTSCFTNQGYFFFHLPDALEIEACQVYFTFDPCAEEEPEEGGPGVPAGSPSPPLPPASGDDDAYCTFPPGDDLLLFSPSLLGGPSSPNTALGSCEASKERLPPSLLEGVPQDWGPQPLGPPAPAAPHLVGSQASLELVLGEAGREGPAPNPGPGAGLQLARAPGQGEVRAPTSCLALNTDAYLSLQELQNQDPAHLV
ncbi:Interleukin-2 receptor subunit beta [Sciurus carolinensis]|uniref:Interleukin-2 receptor subunit beta n=1 Tax=Sciurus carolinensis TaxID=30640 RepID=A0AA41MIB0_SCICA|nr:Interleukin-2 receptor subunit beta [Sciurus carolinensis]